MKCYQACDELKGPFKRVSTPTKVRIYVVKLYISQQATLLAMASRKRVKSGTPKASYLGAVEAALLEMAATAGFDDSHEEIVHDQLPLPEKFLLEVCTYTVLTHVGPFTIFSLQKPIVFLSSP